MKYSIEVRELDNKLFAAELSEGDSLISATVADDPCEAIVEAVKEAFEAGE